MSIKSLFSVSVLAATIASTAPVDGGCTKAESNAIVADLSPVGACIVNELVSGAIADPMLLVNGCAGATLKGVVAVVDTLLAQALPDAGLGAPTPFVVKLTGISNKGHTLLGKTS